MPNQPIDSGQLPLAMVPKGLNVGDSFLVTITGISEDQALVKAVPGAQPNTLSLQQAQTMPLNDLKSFLQNQQATRSYTNPPKPEVPPTV